MDVASTAKIEVETNTKNVEKLKIEKNGEMCGDNGVNVEVELEDKNPKKCEKIDEKVNDKIEEKCSKNGEEKSPKKSLLGGVSFGSILFDDKTKSTVDAELEGQISKLLSEGKRFMIGSDYQNAIEPLSKCCHLISINFGEMDKRLAEPAYYYGSAMLENVRGSSDVFGDQIDDKSEVKEDLEANKDDPILGNDESKSKEADEKRSEETKAETELGAGGDTSGKVAKEEVEGEDEDEEDEDDDRQIAWEWLEIARAIYAKSEEECDQLKLADCYALLGDLKMEMEQLDGAKQDYSEALKIQKKFLKANDRKIAMSHYQIGVVESFLQDPTSSLESFQNAESVLKDALENIKIEIKNEDDVKKVSKLKGQIDDIESLLPEIGEKISESRTMIGEYDRVKSSLKSVFGFMSNSSSSAFGSKSSQTANGNGVGGDNNDTGPGSSKNVIEEGNPVAGSNGEKAASIKVNTLQVKRKSKSDQEGAKRQKLEN